MKVAIVHYHLQPGGVTRVIENTLRSWAESGNDIDAVTLAGRPYPGSEIKRVGLVEGLDYCDTAEAIDAKVLAERLVTAAKQTLGGMPDLWHVHNHSLGKNPALTGAIACLAEEGHPILLHPHDFAEDGRPENFKSLREVYDRTYPVAPRIHYAALNKRDHTFLEKLVSGTESQVHLLANAIPENQAFQAEDTCPKGIPSDLYLYPVRAVRRKNLGEMSLLAAAYPDRYFANSLEPTNPAFRPQFERWKSFSRELQLPVTFGLGHQVDCSFHIMVAFSEAIVTTSVAEGFGLGFLEPWVFGKSLCGRNLPEITGDFTDHQIDLTNLYERLEVDLALLSQPSELRPRIASVLSKFFLDYGVEEPAGSLQIAYDSLVRNNRVDFGRLDEGLQEELILAATGSGEIRKSIRSQAKIERLDSSLIEKNAGSVCKRFSLSTYGTKLAGIYQDLLKATPGKIEFVDGANLLGEFLSPSRLNLLRTT
tara:strand:+ start:19829 stop:21268 length:1440 start_codon:yes stop_codon:yes gene_type:complete